MIAAPTPKKAPASGFGVYIHFPYCLSKCPYCDFASVVAERIPHEAYAEAIAKELELRAARHGRREVESIYFGGGTPSLWEPRWVGQTIRVVEDLFGLNAEPEITLEANPGASEAARFAELFDHGVNRLSIGVQSFAPEVLSGLGREHSVEEAERAVGLAREAGFQSVSLDLIFGGPHQSLAGAEADTRRAISLGPDHISCYGLTLTELAEDVRMAKDVRRGKLKVAGDDLQERMGERVREVLEPAGYHRYEISNYARPGKESRHNSMYWVGSEWVAAGCGAHGFRRRQDGSGVRYANPRKPDAYLAAVEASTLADLEGQEMEGSASLDVISPEALFDERVYLGLRLAAGLDLEEAAAQTIGALPEGTWAAADELVDAGLLVRTGTHVACTPRGMDFHDQVALRLIP